MKVTFFIQSSKLMKDRGEIKNYLDSFFNESNLILGDFLKQFEFKFQGDLKSQTYLYMCKTELSAIESFITRQTISPLVNVIEEKAKALGNLFRSEEQCKKDLDVLKDQYSKTKAQLESFDYQNEAVERLALLFPKDKLGLLSKNKELEQEIKILYKENRGLYKERTDLYEENKIFLAEIQKLTRALFTAYDIYGGLTARIIVDKFYEFFLEKHAKIGCPSHDSLFLDSEKKFFNTQEVNDHWKICAKIAPEKSSFLKAFISKMSEINAVSNKFMYRQKIYEIICPQEIDAELLEEIYLHEKDSIEKIFNGKKSQENLEFIRLERNVNQEAQVKKFYLYMKA